MLNESCPLHVQVCVLEQGTRLRTGKQMPAKHPQSYFNDWLDGLQAFP